MKSKFYKRPNCRLCLSEKIELVLEIGETAISDKYSVNKNDPSDTLVPLDVYMCEACGHVQILHVIDPEYLWADYHFKTSLNKKLNNHYESYVQNSLEYADKISSNFHIDIGSNDGTLMKLYQKQGFKSLGVDPADEIAKHANQNGCETIIDFMNKKTSNLILNKYGKADLITANNVYAHIDDMHELTDSIKSILDENGLFIFEVSYLDDIIKKNLLGTIFHEHLSYHSVIPLISFFKKFNLEIVKIDKSDLQGGSIVCYTQHANGPYDMHESVKKTITEEKNSKLDKIVTLKQFDSNLLSFKNEVNSIINDLIDDGKKIGGFGSAISATTLISYFKIGGKIDFIVDDNEKKHFKFSPQFRIPIFPTKNMYEKNVDCMIIFAWEHNEKIIENNKTFLKKGKFMTIFPEVKLIS